MGIGSSVKIAAHPVLQCPEGYDTNRFKKICVLFDQLDKDSNLGVSSDEISEIARLHVNNCIRRLELRKQANIQSHNQRLEEIDAKTKREMERAKNEGARLIEVAKEEHLGDRTELQTKIEWYQSLDESGRAGAFMKAVVPASQEHIDFWTFFEYMKTRTDDIDNIPQTTQHE